MIMSQILIVIDFDNYGHGNYNYPELIQSKIIDDDEAKIIKYFMKKYEDFEVSFWQGVDWDVKLKNFKIKYISNADSVKAFKKIYGNDYSSCNIYDQIIDAIKRCYRVNVEKSINDNSYYDPESDDLDISKLVINDDGNIEIDATQAF